MIRQLQNNRPESSALDQWRGLALLCVLISHGFYFTNLVHGVGRIGVNLFFFISGILVYKSISSIRTNSSWGVCKTFWKRRLRRLFPALFVYVFLVGILTYFIQNKQNLPSGSDMPTFLKAAPFALFFATNYFGGPQSLIHLWSISCEMQFYLVAPLFFIIGNRLSSHKELNFYLLIFLILFLIPALVYVWSNKGPIFDARYHFTHAAWPIMAGFVAENAKKHFLLPITFARILFYFFLLLSLGSFVVMLFGLSAKVVVIGLGSFFIVPCYISYAYGWAAKGPFGDFLVWLGKRTYSIYLWQEPFTICNFITSFFQPFGAALSILIGSFFYFLFEKPFLSESRQTSST